MVPLWFFMIYFKSLPTVSSQREMIYKHLSSQSDYCLNLSSKQFCNCQCTCTPNSYNSRYYTTTCIAIAIIDFLYDSGTNKYRKIKFSVIKPDTLERDNSLDDTNEDIILEIPNLILVKCRKNQMLY